MRIAIDTTPLLKNLTGVGHVTYKHAYHLHHDHHTSNVYFYAWFWSKTLRNRPIPGMEKKIKRIKSLLPKPYLIAHYVKRIVFHMGLALFRPDIIYQPNFIRLPTLFNIPTLITIHDISFLKYPEYHPKERVEYLSTHLKTSIQGSAKIITVSHFTKQELITEGLAKAASIEVVHCGVSPLFSPIESTMCQTYLKTHLNTELAYQGYFLYVGTLEPRKNLATLLKAYKHYTSHEKNPLKLVIVGMLGWQEEAQKEEIAEMLSNPNILQLGYLTDDALPFLYSGARGFFFPSIYEGFGLPPLEAMACGTPVITSNAASLPEVVGDAGLMYDPYDYKGFAKGMHALHDNAFYETQRHKGLAQSQNFTWEAAGQKLYDIFQKTLSSC